MKFSDEIATVVINTDRDDQVWIGHVEWEDGHTVGINAPALLTITGMADQKAFAISPPETSVGSWRGTLIGSDYPFVVRSTMESDTVNAIPFSGMPSVPMPLAVIKDIIDSEGIFTVPTLYALSEDDGFVATMLLNSDAGLYVRASNAWHLLTNDDVVDGLNFVEVIDSSLDMFDQFDRAGQLVHVSAMQPVAEEFVPIREGNPAEEAPESPITAAVEELLRDVPVITSAEDLPAAISAAADNPEIQWWVERRIKALGIEADLPWANDDDR